MTLPNFIIAGAPKCGTTALFNILAAHPQVGVSRAKEPRFFSRYRGVLAGGPDAGGHRSSGTYDNGFNWYRSLFDGCADRSAIGEASTNYFSYEDSAALIHRHLPDVRLIFMLRDPVERMYSHYWQERKLGWPLPPFPELVAGSAPRARYYESVSHYAVHLTRFLGLFPARRVLVLLQEDFAADPRTEVLRTLEFLGLNVVVDDTLLARQYNQQTRPRSARLEWFMNRARGFGGYTALPGPARRLLRWGKAAVSRANALPFRYEPLDAGTRGALRHRFAEDTAFVEALLDRELSGWRG